MAIIRWNPLMSSLSRWPDFWDDDDFTAMSNKASNNLDVYETEDEIVVKANVAGISADKVDITFEKGTLWITAQAEETQSDDKTKHYSKSNWDYSYRVSVPGTIDQNSEPSAEVENGVVVVTFKKAAISKPKKLTVKAK